MQDDGGGARPSVPVSRSIAWRSRRDAAEQRVGRADQLVEEQVVRRAEERRRRRRDVDGFEPDAERQVVAGWRARRRGASAAWAPGASGRGRRRRRRRRRGDAEVRAVRYESSSSASCWPNARVADVELAKVGQFPHVKHVVLRLDELGLRVLRRVGEVSEAVEGRHLAALELRPADERRVAVRGDLEAEVVRVPREHELGVALRVRRLRREARELRVEEVLRIEDDVAVPAVDG